MANRTVVVTGAGRGIGEAIALAFAGTGANTVLASRTAPELESVAARVRALGASALTVVADVTRAQDVTRLVDSALTAYGQIDVLVNNAGTYGPIGPFAESDIDEWCGAIDTNLKSVARCSRAIIPLMLGQRAGVIINLSGGGAASPLPNFTAYSVSKTAVVRLTENLAEELKPFGIRVNAIAPGMVNTRLQDAVVKAGDRAGELYGRIRTLQETGQGGVPPTLAAELAVFLASAAGAGITGKLIAAAHDPWREWASTADTIPAAMYTLRRLDPFTLKPFKHLL